MPTLNEHVRKSLIAGTTASILLAGLIVLGSRGMRHFDHALSGYAVATLFATFGVVYRCTMWLQRPPTAMYWKHGWRAFLSPRLFLRNIFVGLARVLGQVGLQRFIWIRARARWTFHALIAWGCILAGMITFPLVFGWVSFQTLPGDFESYRVFVFGFPTLAFRVQSITGLLAFHALAIASGLVILGTGAALVRRVSGRAPAGIDDLLPLILLLAISITGLSLTASDFLFGGAGHPVLSRVHEITVIATLLWLPFGKFLHIFQRPMHVGVQFYQDVAKQTPPGTCASCGQMFATEKHLTDLANLEETLGFKYALSGSAAQHYQRICPTCRRVMLMKSRLALESSGSPA